MIAVSKASWFTQGQGDGAQLEAAAKTRLAKELGAAVSLAAETCAHSHVPDNHDYKRSMSCVEMLLLL